MHNLKNKIKSLETDIILKKTARENDFSLLKNFVSSPGFIVGSVAVGLTLGALICVSVIKFKKAKPTSFAKKTSTSSMKNENTVALLVMTALITLLRVFRRFI